MPIYEKQKNNKRTRLFFCCSCPIVVICGDTVETFGPFIRTYIGKYLIYVKIIPNRKSLVKRISAHFFFFDKNFGKVLRLADYCVYLHRLLFVFIKTKVDFPDQTNVRGGRADHYFERAAFGVPSVERGIIIRKISETEFYRHPFALTRF